MSSVEKYHHQDRVERLQTGRLLSSAARDWVWLLNQCPWFLKRQTQTIIKNEKLWNFAGLSAVGSRWSAHVDFPLPGPNLANLDVFENQFF